MSFLIDTHTMLWYLKGDEQLSKKSIDVLEDQLYKKFVSIASLWEMSIKLNLGKLKIEYEFTEIESRLEALNISILNISFEQIKRLTHIPLHHRDPFDRMIIAQAITENLTIISKDKNFSLYPIKLLW